MEENKSKPFGDLWSRATAWSIEKGFFKDTPAAEASLQRFIDRDAPASGWDFSLGWQAYCQTKAYLPAHLPTFEASGERVYHTFGDIFGTGLGALKSILSRALENKITDIYVSPQFYVKSRRGGRLENFLGKNPSGRFVPIAVDNTDFKSIINSLNFEFRVGGTRVYRPDPATASKYAQQMRALYLPAHFSDQLFLRFQPLSPTPIDVLLKHHGSLLSDLKDARGLILVIGDIGGGKTSLASAIASFWGYDRHVMTIEDPIEYQLHNESDGAITQIECPFTISGLAERQKKNLSADADSNEALSLRSALALSFRSDVNAVFVSECRSGEQVASVVDFAAGNAPFVTTFHGGVIPLALSRFTSLYASESQSLDSAKLAISQSIHSVLHVSLAYNDLDQPIPVIASLPLHQKQNPRVQEILKLDPATLQQGVSDFFATDDINAGIVSYRRAIDIAAKEFGATKASLDVLRKKFQIES